MNGIRYLLASNSFSDAARYAAEQDWHLSEWLWCPFYTVHSGVWMFERTQNEV